MALSIVYRQASEHRAEVEGYLKEFTYRTGKEIKVIDPDSVDGAEFCRLYDVVEYPTIVATKDDGQMRESWRGIPFPLIDEVSYYV